MLYVKYSDKGATLLTGQARGHVHGSTLVARGKRRTTPDDAGVVDEGSDGGTEGEVTLGCHVAGSLCVSAYTRQGSERWMC